MIREYKPSDLNAIMSIWLSGNEQAHPFIDPQYFKKNYDLVKSLIGASTVFVQDINGIKGFIGLSDNYIAGLFVDKNSQHQKIGSSLIEQAKKIHNELLVHVYKKNEIAISFYLSQGFEIIEESINEDTNEPELLMSCVVKHSVKIGKCAL